MSTERYFASASALRTGLAQAQKTADQKYMYLLKPESSPIETFAQISLDILIPDERIIEAYRKSIIMLRTLITDTQPQRILITGKSAAVLVLPALTGRNSIPVPISYLGDQENKILYKNDIMAKPNKLRRGWIKKPTSIEKRNKLLANKLSVNGNKPTRVLVVDDVTVAGMKPFALINILNSFGIEDVQYNALSLPSECDLLHASSYDPNLFLFFKNFTRALRLAYDSVEFDRFLYKYGNNRSNRDAFRKLRTDIRKLIRVSTDIISNRIF